MSAPDCHARTTSVGVRAPGKARLAVAARHFDDLGIERGRDNELRARQQSRPAALGVEDRSRAQQHLVPELLRHLFHDVDGVRNGHGDFGDADPAFDNGFGCAQGVLGRGRAHDGNKTDFTNSVKAFSFVQDICVSSKSQ